MRIGVVEVFLDDQDTARAFTARIPREGRRELRRHRWLVDRRVARGSRRLRAPVGAVERGGRGAEGSSRETGAPAVSFTTQDCQRDYRELVGRGAVFVSAPQQMGYGGTDAVFERGCGNLLNLHQD